MAVGAATGDASTATGRRVPGTAAVTTLRSVEKSTARRCAAISDERSLALIRTRAAAMHAVSEAASTGTPLPTDLELPDDETLKPVTEAVRALSGVLASGWAGRRSPYRGGRPGGSGLAVSSGWPCRRAGRI
jgi:hypothetical protein